MTLVARRTNLIAAVGILIWVFSQTKQQIFFLRSRQFNSKYWRAVEWWHWIKGIASRKLNVAWGWRWWRIWTNCSWPEIAYTCIYISLLFFLLAPFWNCGQHLLNTGEHTNSQCFLHIQNIWTKKFNLKFNIFIAVQIFRRICWNFNWCGERSEWHTYYTNVKENHVAKILHNITKTIIWSLLCFTLRNEDTEILVRCFAHPTFKLKPKKWYNVTYETFSKEQHNS